MSTGELWKLLVGTVVGVGTLIGVFVVKMSLRKRLVSRLEGTDRGRAMMELLALRAKLQKDALRAEDPGLVSQGNRAPPEQDGQVPGQGPGGNSSGRGGRGEP